MNQLLEDLIPTSELKSSIMHNFDVKSVKDYSDNYSYVVQNLLVITYFMILSLLI